MREEEDTATTTPARTRAIERTVPVEIMEVGVVSAADDAKGIGRSVESAETAIFEGEQCDDHAVVSAGGNGVCGTMAGITECNSTVFSPEEKDAGDRAARLSAAAASDGKAKPGTAVPCTIDLTVSDNEDLDADVLTGEYQDAVCPGRVAKIRHTENLSRLIIPDIGRVDWRGCGSKCTTDRCANARVGMFCAKNNCRVSKGCGNRLRNVPKLQLKMGPLGYTVFASEFIPSCTVAGEYAGVPSAHDYTADRRQTFEYVVQLQTRSSHKQKLDLDAKERSGLIRFVSHFCNVNCRFFEVHTQRFLTVVVASVEDILPGAEITVDYGDAIRSTCKCGALICRSK